MTHQNAERAEAALAAVPWQALLNIYECLTLPAVALDGDVGHTGSVPESICAVGAERKPGMNDGTNTCRTHTV